MDESIRMKPVLLYHQSAIIKNKMYRTLPRIYYALNRGQSLLKTFYKDGLLLLPQWPYEGETYELCFTDKEEQLTLPLLTLLASGQNPALKQAVGLLAAHTNGSDPVWVASSIKACTRRRPQNSAPPDVSSALCTNQVLCFC